jgi:hypothetical protein
MSWPHQSASHRPRSRGPDKGDRLSRIGSALPQRSTAIADVLYVVLAERLRASLLTDGHKLVNSPTFPSGVPCLTIP